MLNPLLPPKRRHIIPKKESFGTTTPAQHRMNRVQRKRHYLDVVLLPLTFSWSNMIRATPISRWNIKVEAFKVKLLNVDMNYGDHWDEKQHCTYPQSLTPFISALDCSSHVFGSSVNGYPTNAYYNFHHVACSTCMAATCWSFNRKFSLINRYIQGEGYLSKGYCQRLPGNSRTILTLIETRILRV